MFDRKPWPLLVVLATILLGLSSSVAVFAQFGFVTNSSTQEVTLVDFSSGQLSGQYSLPGSPAGIALSGNTLYVVSPDAGTLSVIDTATGTSQVVMVPGTPTGVAVTPAGDRVYVSDPVGEQVVRVDPLTFTIAQTVTVPGQPLAIETDGIYVYVALYGNASLEVLDPNTLAHVATVPVGHFPMGVAIDGPRGRIWVSSVFDDTVTVIDCGTFTTVGTLTVPRAPRAIEVLPNRAEVYVASFSPDAGPTPITVFDAGTLGVVDTIGTGRINPFDLLAAADESGVWVLHLGDSELVAIDTATRQITESIALGPSHVQIAGVSTSGFAATAIPTLSGLGGFLLMALIVGLGWKLIGSRAAIAFLLVVLAPVAVRAQTLFFLDTELRDGDWSRQEIGSSGGVEQAIQMSAGGNPGAFRQMSHQGGASLLVVHEYIGTAGSYDPSTRGALSHIDFRWDRRFGLAEGPSDMGEGPAIVQADGIYLSSAENFSSLSWEAASWLGLGANDFALVGSGLSPDFSASAPPITFGFARRTDFGFVQHDLDNFSISAVNAAPANLGEVRFVDNTFFQIDGFPADVGVERVGGSDAEITATIAGRFSSLPGNCTLTWADGELGVKNCVANFSGLSGLGNNSLRIDQVTNGATIGTPNRAALWVFESDESFLAGLILYLLSGWGPATTFALAATALAAAFLRRRSKAKLTREVRARPLSEPQRCEGSFRPAPAIRTPRGST